MSMSADRQAASQAHARVLARHKEPDQRSHHRSVGPVEPKARIGTVQHGDLVPQHEQLGVLGGR
jgi:hypothetical protein